MAASKKDNKKKKSSYTNETKHSLDILIGDLHFHLKNEHQRQFWKLIDEKEIVICSGPAGVGKSMLSAAKALELLKDPNSEYYKIIVCTPTIEVGGNSIGFLPGNIEDKLSPYNYSTIYLLEKLIGKSKVETLMKEGYIEIMGLGFMRGINIDNAIVIAEEFQNATHLEVKTLLTRIGYNSKFIVSGDLEQSDKFKKLSDTGLHNAFHRLENKGINEIGFFRFEQSDIVRNKLISKILDNYKD
mgnify:CR=1 FL=1